MMNENDPPGTSADPNAGLILSERPSHDDNPQGQMTDLAVLYRIGLICCEARAEDELLGRTTQLLAETLFPDNCGFLLLDPDRSLLITHPSFVITDSTVCRADKQLGAGITGHVALTGKTVRTGDVRQEPHYLRADPRTRSEMCIPIRIGTKVVGVFNAESHREDAFSAIAEQLATTVVSLTGNALERLRAEEKLRKSEEHLRAILDSEPECVKLVDRDCRIRDMNPAGLAMVEAESIDQVRGCNVLDLIAPENREAYRNSAAEVFRGASIRHEFEIIGLKGTRRWMEQHAVGLKQTGRTDQVDMMLAVTRDVTERKRAESSLRRSNQLLSALSRTQADFISGTPLPRLFEEMLGMLLEITGGEYGFIGEVLHTPGGEPYLQPRAITNSTPRSEMREYEQRNAIAARVFSNLHAMLDDVRARGEALVVSDAARACQALAATGSAPGLAFLGLPVHRGEEPIGVVALVHGAGGYDREQIEFLEPFLQTCAALITGMRTDQKRQRAEQALATLNANLEQQVVERTQALRESEERLRLANEAAGIGTYIADLRTGGFRHSPRLGAMLGLKPGVESTRDDFFQRVHPEDRARLRASLDGALDPTRGGRHEVDLRLLLPNGGIRWMSFRGQVEFSDVPGDRIPLRQIGAAFDITDRVRLFEGQLAHANRASMMGEMVSTVVHELSQPLATLANNVGACRRGIESHTLSESEILTTLAASSAEAERAGEIIRRIRKFLARQIPSPSALDVGELMLEVVELCRAEAACHGIALQVELAPGLPSISGDRVSLQQVLMNLVRNAVDSLRDAPQSTRTVRLTVATHDDRMTISVADNGPGVPPVLAEEIFKPYFTTKPEGMGMGLAICQTIVESHAGQIRLEQGHRPGATFHIELPLTKEPQ